MDNVTLKDFIKDYSKIQNNSSQNIDDLTDEIRNIITITKEFQKESISDSEIRGIIEQSSKNIPNQTIKVVNKPQKNTSDNIKDTISELKDHAQTKTDYVLGETKDILKPLLTTSKNMFGGIRNMFGNSDDLNIKSDNYVASDTSIFSTPKPTPDSKIPNQTIKVVNKPQKNTSDNIKDTISELKDHAQTKTDYVLGEIKDILKPLNMLKNFDISELKNYAQTKTDYVLGETKDVLEPLLIVSKNMFGGIKNIFGDSEKSGDHVASDTSMFSTPTSDMKVGDIIDPIKETEIASDCACKSLKHIDSDTTTIIGLIEQYMSLGDNIEQVLYDINDSLDNIYDLNKAEVLRLQRDNAKNKGFGIFKKFMTSFIIGSIIGSVIGYVIKQFSVVFNIMRGFKTFIVDMGKIGKGFQKAFTFGLRKNIGSAYVKLESLITNNIRRLFNVQRLWNTSWNKAMDIGMDITNHTNLLLEHLKSLFSEKKLIKTVTFIQDYLVEIRKGLLSVRNSVTKAATWKIFKLDLKAMFNEHLINNIEGGLKGFGTKLASLLERIPLLNLLTSPSLSGFIAGVRSGIEKIGPALMGIFAVFDFVTGWAESTKKDFFGKLQDAVKKMTITIVELPIRIMSWAAEKMLNLVGVEVSGIGDMVMEKVNEMLDTFSGTVIALYKTLQSFFPDMSKEYGSVMTKITNIIKGNKFYIDIATKIENIKGLVTGFFSNILSRVKSLLPLFRSSGPSLTSKIIEFFSNIKKTVDTWLNIVKGTKTFDILQKIFRFLDKVSRMLYKGSSVVVKFIWTTLGKIRDVLSFASNIVKNIDISLMITKFFGIFHQIFDSTKVIKELGMFSKWTTVIKEVMKIIGSVFKFLGATVRTIGSGIGGMFKIFKPILGLVKGVAKFLPFLKPFLMIFSFIKGFVTAEGGLLNKIMSGLKSMIISLVELPVMIVGWIVDWIGGLFGFDNINFGDKVMSIINTVIDTMIGIFTHPIDILKNLGSMILEGSKNLFSIWWEYNPISLLIKMFKKMGSMILEGSKSLLGFLFEYSPIGLMIKFVKYVGKKIIDMFNLDSVVDAITGHIKSFFDWIEDITGSMLDKVRNIASKLSFGLIDTAEEKKSKEKEKSIKDTAISNIKTIFESGVGVDDFGANKITDIKALQKYSKEELQGILKHGNWEDDAKANIVKAIESKNSVPEKIIKKDIESRYNTKTSKGVSDTKISSARGVTDFNKDIKARYTHNKNSILEKITKKDIEESRYNTKTPKGVSVISIGNTRGVTDFSKIINGIKIKYTHNKNQKFIWNSDDLNRFASDYSMGRIISAGSVNIPKDKNHINPMFNQKQSNIDDDIFDKMLGIVSTSQGEPLNPDKLIISKTNAKKKQISTQERIGELISSTMKDTNKNIQESNAKPIIVNTDSSGSIDPPEDIESMSILWLNKSYGLG